MTEFRSRWGVYLTSIVINGRARPIRFKELRDGNSYYATSKWEEEQALMNHPQFNIDFYLFRKDPAVVQPERRKVAPIIKRPVEKAPVAIAKASEEQKREEPETTKVEAVTNISQAREHLRSAGADYRRLKTPRSIMRCAGEMGIEFPNLKSN